MIRVWDRLRIRIRLWGRVRVRIRVWGGIRLSISVVIEIIVAVEQIS